MKNVLLRNELQAVFSNRKLLIPILAILFIPILYSGMFLWAFWDPYGQLSELPVAIVNEDQGMEYEGKQLTLGDDLVEKLKDSDQFNYSFISKKEAEEGLRDQKYYMIVEIPKNFSEHATTLLNENPEKLELTYVPNEGYNFLASQIGANAVEKIKSSIASKVTETYAESIFSSVDQLANGVSDASDGANQLYDGSVDLLNGSTTLNAKLAEFVQGANTFATKMNEAKLGSNDLHLGAGQLSSGLSQLDNGEKSLLAASGELQQGASDLSLGATSVHQGLVTINEKVPELLSGTTELKTGASNLSSGLSSLQAGATQVNNGVVALKQSLQAVLASLPTGSPERVQIETTLAGLEASTKTIADKAGVLASGAGNLSNGLGDLESGQQQLASGVSQLSSGAGELEQGAKKLAVGESDFQAGMTTFSEKLVEATNGAEKLASGSSTLASGLNQLTDASNTLATGSVQLKEGSNQLLAGTDELSKGTETLSTALVDGANEAANVSATDATYKMIASPVKVTEKEVNKVDNYGTGFAPYFFSLGLFVGSLLLTIVFPLKEPASVPKNGFNWFISKFVMVSGIGTVQGIIAATILLAGLGLKVQSLAMFYLFAIITSITFVAIVQLLVTTLGDPGRFIAILILILQLTTSAGTFPLELIPSQLQPIHSFLPMSYTVEGFKAVISSGNFSLVWSDISVLLVYAIVCGLGTLAYFTWKHKRQFAVLAQEK